MQFLLLVVAVLVLSAAPAWASTVQITEIPVSPGVSGSQVHAVVAGDVVAYQDGLDGTLKGYDTRTGAQLFSHPLSGFPNDALKMAGWGDYFVWSDSHPNSVNHLHLFDVRTLTDSVIAVTSSASYPDIDDGIVVWSVYGGATTDVYSYNVATRHQSVLFSSPYYLEDVRFSDRTVVWRDNRTGNYDIYSYNLDSQTETPVCTAAGMQGQADICGDVVAWLDMRTGDYQLRAKRLSAGNEFLIVSGGGPHYYPRITPFFIAYQSGSTRVSVYDMATGGSYGLSGTAYPEATGADGEVVAWGDNRNNATSGWDIYAARVISWSAALSLGEGAFATSRSVEASLTASSSDAAVTEMRFSFDGFTWGPWQTYAAETILTLTGSEGPTTVWAQYRDGHGNTSDIVSDSIVLDATSPTTLADADGLWHHSHVTVGLSASDSGTGVAGTHFAIDGDGARSGDSIDVEAPADHANDGVHPITFWSVDTAGNIESANSCAVKIDTTPPVTSQSGSDDAWHDTPVTVSFSAVDPKPAVIAPVLSAASGVDYIEYRLGLGGDWTPGTSVIVPAPADTKATTTVYFRAVDKAGNGEAVQSCEVRIDTTPPPPSDIVAPQTSVHGVDAAWHSTPVDVSFSAQDSGENSSGVDYTEYRLDDGVWTQGTTLTVTAPADTSGIHTIRFRSCDEAGNLESEQSCTVNIDAAKPSTQAWDVSVRRGASVALPLRVNDPVPGCGAATVTIQVLSAGRLVATVAAGRLATNTSLTCPYTATLRKGSYVYRVLATDDAGNVATSIGSARLVVK